MSSTAIAKAPAQDTTGPAPVFIAGHPKGGTSLVAAMLDSHPQLLVIPEETDAVSMFVGAIRRPAFQFGSPEKRVGIIVDLFQHISHLRNLFRGKVDDDIGGNFDYTDFDTTVFVATLKDELAKARPSLRSLLFAIASAYGRATSHLRSAGRAPKHWVEKTATHSSHLRLLARVFPEAHFIHVIRDPRDNWISRQKKNPELDIVDYALKWVEIERQAEAVRSKWPERLLCVKYESLVEDPAAEGARIAAFLGIDFDDHLLHPSKFGKPWLGNSMWDRSKRGISTDAVGRYKGRIDPREHAILESLTGEWMERAGYRRELPEDGPALATLIPRMRLNMVNSAKSLRIRFLGGRFLR